MYLPGYEYHSVSCGRNSRFYTDAYIVAKLLVGGHISYCMLWLLCVVLLTVWCVCALDWSLGIWLARLSLFVRSQNLFFVCMCLEREVGSFRRLVVFVCWY